MAIWSTMQYVDLSLEGREVMTQSAKAFMDRIANFVPSHSAWSVADRSEKVIDQEKADKTGAMIPFKRVSFATLTLKNEGRFNIAGLDFYVTFITTGTVPLAPPPATGTPKPPPPVPYRELLVSVSEGYESGEPPQLVRPAPGPGLELTSPAPDGSVGGGRGYNLYNEKDPLTGAPAINSSQLFLPSMQLNSRSKYRYGIYASRNSLVIFNGPVGPAGTAQQTVTAVGMFQSLMEQDPCPLFLSNSQEAKITRMPYVVASQPDNWRLRASWTPGQRWTVASGVLNQGGDLMHSGRPISSRIAVLHRGRSDTHGGLRGVFFDSEQILSGRPPQIGDVIDIEGNPHVVIHTVGTGSGGAVGVTTVVNLNSP